MFLNVQAKIKNAALAAIAAIFSLVSFGVFFREYNSFYAGAGMRASAYVTAPDAFAHPPLGLASTAREVERCFDAKAQLRSGILKAELRKIGYQSCLDLADRVLNVTPAHAGTLQMRTEMLLALNGLGGDSGTPLAQILAAQSAAAAAAPNTVWLMQRRLLVALEMFAKPASAQEASLQAMVVQDLPKLLALSQQRRWVADLYLRHDSLRPLVASLDGKISASDAESFLRMVRAGAKGQSRSDASGADGNSP